MKQVAARCRDRRPLRWTMVVLALGLVACGTAEHDPAALRFGIATAPSTLDPRFATDAASVRANRLLYRSLVGFDAASKPVPDLAQWRRMSPTHYRFTLGQEGRRFHDGSDLTAADVVATYRSVLDPATGSPRRRNLSLIDSVEAVDDDTVDFHLASPDPDFPGYLTLGIVPRDMLESDQPLRRRAVGSGPFELAAPLREGRLRLQRTRDGQAVALVAVSDPMVRTLKLLRGELDMMQNDLPPELVRFLESRDGVGVRRHQGTNFTYLGFNLEDPVTGRHAVRAAVAYAIDRHAIIRHLWGDAAREANALLPPGHWAGHPALEGRRHDPDRARALLAEVDGPVRLTYKTSSDPFRVRLATVIRQQLEAVGIEVDLRSYDWGTFYGDVQAGRFQMYSLSWVGIRTTDIFRYAFHSESLPPQGANRGRFRSAEADRLIEAAERAEDRSERAGHLHRLQAHLMEALPYVPLWYEDHVFVSRTGVTGYSLSPDGHYDGLVTVRRTAPQTAPRPPGVPRE